MMDELIQNDRSGSGDLFAQIAKDFYVLRFYLWMKSVVTSKGLTESVAHGFRIPRNTSCCIFAKRPCQTVYVPQGTPAPFLAI